MRFEVRANSELEGWDVIDTKSKCGSDDQDSHWVATFYDSALLNLFLLVLNAVPEDLQKA